MASLCGRLTTVPCPVAGEEPIRSACTERADVAVRSDATSRVEVGAKGLEPSFAHLGEWSFGGQAPDLLGVILGGG